MSLESTAVGATQGMTWIVFVTQPALYIDASRLAECLDPQAGLDLCVRLKATARLEKRLSDRVRSHYGLAARIASEAVGDIDRAIALATAEQLTDLARRSGAIYWADSIANVVLAQDVEAIDAALGAPLCAFALDHRDLSGPVQPLEPFGQLHVRLMDDGWRCLAAWCAAQADGVGARVRLKLAASPLLDGPIESPFDQRGPAIVRRAGC
jgi:hypothetical protein